MTGTDRPSGDSAAQADADLHQPRPHGNEDAELVPGEPAQHHGADDDRTTRSVPLEDEGGGERVVEQEPVGRPEVEGGGEFPQPAREPTLPAPGAIEDDAGGEPAPDRA